jgi:hypothetical protein
MLKYIYFETDVSIHSNTAIVGSNPVRNMGVSFVIFCVVLSFVGRGIEMGLICTLVVQLNS